MATFIKTGFWEKARKGYKEWLNLDELIQSLAPPAPEPAYKVFTALLTQSGGSAFGDRVSGDTLTLGVTYLIAVNPDNEDLTIFGAPNSNVGTHFICTTVGVLTSANLYFDYGAPVTTVLENTIGNIWFTYVDTGQYYINSPNLFTNNKTYTVIQLWGDDGVSTRTGVVQRFDSSILALYNHDYTGEYLVNTIGYFGFLTSIEIRVYN